MSPSRRCIYNCDVNLSTSIKLLDKLTLQICSLLCVSLTEVQGNSLIFMEIRDNIHQLSFTLSICISFLILTLSACRPLSARFGWVFWTAETGESLRSLLWELYQTHTPWTWWASKLHLTLSVLYRITVGIFTFSWREKVRFLPLALPAAHTQSCRTPSPDTRPNQMHSLSHSKSSNSTQNKTMAFLRVGAWLSFSNVHMFMWILTFV